MLIFDLDDVGMAGREIDCQFEILIDVLDCLVVELEGSRNHQRSRMGKKDSDCHFQIFLSMQLSLSMLRCSGVLVF